MPAKVSNRALLRSYVCRAVAENLRATGHNFYTGGKRELVEQLDARGLKKEADGLVEAAMSTMPAFLRGEQAKDHWQKLVEEQ